jgi:hypothetical protein
MALAPADNSRGRRAGCERSCLHLFLIGEAFLLMLFHRRPLELLDVPAECGGNSNGRRVTIFGCSVRRKPRVLHDTLEAASAGGVRDEHHAEEVAGLSGDVLWKGKWGVDDILVEEVDVVTVGVGRVIVEWKIPRQHGVKDNAAAPDVNGTANIEALAYDEFRGGVAWAAAACLHEVVRTVFEAIGEPEVGDDHVPMSIEQQVLELQVAMDDFLLVDVPDAGYELGEELGGVALAEVAVSEDVVEQLAPRRVF